MDEQFVQDAICRPDRIKSVLRQIDGQKYNWEFRGRDEYKNVKEDVINQEFSFSETRNGVTSGGRLDVIATFENRTKLFVCEVKLIATPDDFEQLNWYMKNVPRQILGPESVGGTDYVGLLLCHELYRTESPPPFPEHCYAAELLSNDDLSFKVIHDWSQVSKVVPESNKFKHSSLVSIQEWVDYIDDSLKPLLADLASGFSIPERERWLVANPKSRHIAIHFKGTYVLFVFPYVNRLEIGYDMPDGTRKSSVIFANAPNLSSERQIIERDLATICAAL